MSERKLLFQYNSSKAQAKGDINIIRVYNDGTYTADGRRDEIMKWKLDNGKIWWMTRSGKWDEWDSDDFINHLSLHALENAIEGVNE